MLVGFLSFSSFFWRWVCRGFSSSVAPLFLALALLLSPWGLLFLLLRRLLFVRVPRPRRPRGWRGVPSWCARWCCVPASSLPGLRASCFVFSVVPAVVSRRTGAVLWFWCWCSFPGLSGADMAPAGCGGYAAAALFTPNRKEVTA